MFKGVYSQKLSKLNLPNNTSNSMYNRDIIIQMIASFHMLMLLLIGSEQGFAAALLFFYFFFSLHTWFSGFIEMGRVE